MNIKKILNGIQILNNFDNFDTDIEDISYDSRNIHNNSLFVCLSGKSFNGHDYAFDAMQKGAKAVICEKNLGFENQIIVENSRSVLSMISSNFFGNPSKNLNLISVTGTKGKTTTSSFICNSLNNAGIKTVQIGTLGAIFQNETIPTCNTTPESYEIQKFLRKAVDENFKFVVIEASSIGLKDHRLDNLIFDYGIFTNLSNDHISECEHPNLDDYIKSKSILFRKSKIGLINCDDPSYRKVIKGHTCEIITYGFNPISDVLCYKFETMENCTGSKFVVNNKQFEISIPGKFNIYNAMSSIYICDQLGIEYSEVTKSLKSCKIRGRTEQIFKNENFSIIIDYAHNSFGLENIIQSLREGHPKRIVTLFGAGGNRPKSRRFSMGKVSGKLSDLSVITSDNSRFESTDEIIDDIKCGIIESGGEFVVIPDRKKAIEYCIKNVQNGDIIILAGKGHESYQEINGIRYHFDEREIVYDILKNEGLIA